MVSRNLSRVLGRGAEGGVYLVEQENTVVKVDEGWRIKIGPFCLHIKWQTDWEDHYPKCREAYKAVSIPIVESQLKKEFLGFLAGGEVIKGDISLEVPYFSDMEDLKLRYRDVIDPEIGPRILRELYSFIVKADHLYNERQLGLDPYGGEIIMDVAMGLSEILAQKIEEMLPVWVRNIVRRNVFKLEGLVRNVIKLDDNVKGYMENAEEGSLLGFVDLGMHDFSETGKWKFATRLVHHLMIGSLSEVIKRCNSRFPADKRISEEDIALLDNYFNGTEIHAKLAALLVDLLMPLMDKAVEVGGNGSVPMDKAVEVGGNGSVPMDKAVEVGGN